MDKFVAEGQESSENTPKLTEKQGVTPGEAVAPSKTVYPGKCPTCGRDLINQG